MSVINKQAYGIGNPIFGVQQKPIRSNINPGVRNRAEIGTIWINETTNDFWVLTSVAAGLSNWATPSNGAGLFASITVNPGDVTVVAGDIIANAGSLILDAGNIQVTLGNITAAAGNITATLGQVFGNTVASGTTIAAGTTITATGNITSNAGDIIATLGDFNALSGNLLLQDASISDAAPFAVLAKNRAGGIITSGDGLGVVTFSGYDGTGQHPSAAIAVVSTGTIGAGRVPSDMEFSTSPDAVSIPQLRVIIPADGGLEIQAPTTATTPPLVLPGPVNIYTGAGAPAGALGINVGDMYINTTAASALTRLYICTAAGVFTNVTCAA